MRPWERDSSRQNDSVTGIFVNVAATAIFVIMETRELRRWYGSQGDTSGEEARQAGARSALMRRTRNATSHLVRCTWHSLQAYRANPSCNDKALQKIHSERVRFPPGSICTVTGLQQHKTLEMMEGNTSGDVQYVWYM